MYFQDDFNDGDISDWTLVDGDGDTFDWNAVELPNAASDTVKAVRSSSYLNQVGPLTPDNYMISSAVDLSAEDGSTTLTLSWDVAGVDPSWSEEMYSVYVATAADTASLLASSVTFTEVVTDNGPGGIDNLYTKTLDVTSFVGQTIYVAFRHHNSTNQFAMVIDNVSVYSGDMGVDKFNAPIAFQHLVQNGQLQFSANKRISRVSIYNLLGQEVATQSINANTGSVSVEKLASGVYLSKALVGDSIQSFKFVVN